MRKITDILFVAILLSACASQPKETKLLDDDAAWCWFSDPRAIAFSNDSVNKIISGGVSEDGSIIAFSYNTKDQSIQEGIIHAQLEYDDHNNPAFMEDADGHLLAFYTRHHNNDMYMARSQFPGDVSSWMEPVRIDPVNEEELKLYGKPRYTYANPAMLSAENNRIYLFGRWTGFKPTMCWSDDQGKTWSDSRVMISPQPFDPGNRPYVKYFSKGKQRIHMTFTDGHPRNESNNSVYYAYYEDSGFYRANGDMICSIEDLPFAPKEATLVYDATETGHRSWVYDIKEDEKGFPVIAYARYPTEEEHLYYYARFDGSEWLDRKVCDSGSWFPETPEGENEREPHYSGGLAIDGNDVTTVYLSRQVEGIFEIEKWQLKDAGEWSSEAVTSNSLLDQVRPVVPWWTSKESPEVLWMENEKYVHYTDYESSIKIMSGEQ